MFHIEQIRGMSCESSHDFLKIEMTTRQFRFLQRKQMLFVGCEMRV